MERKLWYRQPACAWEEALPLGNGILGMMVYGGMETDRIQLSEKTMWSGYPYDNDNPECLTHLQEMRDLLFAGKNAEAEALCEKYLVCREGSGERYTGPFGSFQPTGDLFLSYTTAPLVCSDNYRRELDLYDGVARVSFGKTVRTYFASEKYEVTVIAVEKGEVSDLKIAFSPESGELVTEGKDALICRGRFEGDGASSYCTVISVVAEGQNARTRAGADSESKGVHANGGRILIYATTATSYKTDADPETVCRARIAAAKEAGYEAILSDHIARHNEVMDRATITLEGEDRSALATDERLEAMQRGGEDISFSELYFAYGKYLLMSCSRGLLPSNLQGIWVKNKRPPWAADFHININLQMMYWPAEVAGLSEYIAPLFRYIGDLAEAGEKTARVQYGCRGWVAHTWANPWGFTAPGTHPSWGAFSTAGAWCCRQIWEHWLYTGDDAFLESHYPLIRGSAVFFLDFLVKDPRTGYLVTAPSNSPENHYFDPVTGASMAMCEGPTMDNTIIGELFDMAIACAERFGVDADLATQWKNARADLPPIKVGKHGQIMEWQEDYEEVEPGHRHISQLYGLYPAAAITRDKTPALLEASRVSLRRRLENGGGHTGWSRAWVLCFFARLCEGNDAYKTLLALYTTGTYRNLFDYHPPALFQIDGNFGGTAGIAEMLLQSHEEVIRILPALPDKWENGRFDRLRARGGFLVSAAWQKGALASLTVESTLGTPLRIAFAGKEVKMPTERGGVYHLL